MNLDNFNNLIELFFYQSEKQKSENIFLEWLNPNNKKIYTWEETKQNILKLSKKLKETVKDGDRCLLVSENRPEWFISDLAIMLAGGVTVPAYTTYTEEDYKYLIEDSEPSLSKNDLKNLIIDRSKIYCEAKYKINCETLTKNMIVNQIVKLYEKN